MRVKIDWAPVDISGDQAGGHGRQCDVKPGHFSKAQTAAATKLTTFVGKVVDDGVGPVLGSQDYAERRLQGARREGRSEAEAVEAAIASVIRESVAMAGAAGFVGGLGGLVAMPVMLPANMVGSLAINAHMVGASFCSRETCYLIGLHLHLPVLVCNDASDVLFLNALDDAPAARVA